MSGDGAQARRAELPPINFHRPALFFLSALLVASGSCRQLDVLSQVHPSATAADRKEAHRRADALQAEASDYNLNRVKAVLDKGLTVREAAAELNLPLDAVERFRQILDWRHGQDTCYVLTDKALAMFDERGEDQAAEAASKGPLYP